MTFSKDNLRQIFQHPFNQQEWQQILLHFFHAKDLRKEPERIDGTTDDEQGYYLGVLDTSDSYRIGLFYYQIQHGNVARKRVGLRNLVKSFVNPNWGEFDAALVVFDSGKLWRLSFVSDIKGESTAPKRYTYVFGEGDSFYNTPVGRFDALQRKGISFENIKEAFSVEALSKEFFDEYREHYADIVEFITGKRYVKEKGKWVEKTIHEPCHEIFNQFVAVYKDPEKTVRDYIKKLMGRLVFLQFLQKKEWMGVPADRQDWTGGDTRFLQNKFNEFADKDNFIDGFLEPLFNDLNTNRQDNGDIASPKVGKDIKIPFLNGGLFQLDEEDCTDIRLPQHLLGGVLEFFERYNFTIDENDPNDAQIGVDPEMLGRVFENLLEDNKDKGAFYTPKEIVQYMCQESLIAYLQTDVDDEPTKEAIRQFVLTHDADTLGNISEDIFERLRNVKICDPAIGSGAFPMGLLRELYLCSCAIRPDMAEKAPADIKRHIIQNNIYGVDIEKGAVDIARLRFWLSLIVDEDTPKFLPNLDFKIMQGNSLLEQYKGVDLSKMTELKKEKQEGTQLSMFEDMLDVLRLDLRKKLNEYYNCPDHQRKEHLKQEIIDNVKKQLREQSINVDFGELDLSGNYYFFIWHTWFYDVFSQGGFDIVIGNPPYGVSIKDQYRKAVVGIWGNVPDYEIYYYFIQVAEVLLRVNGILSYIIPNTYLFNNFAKNYRLSILERWNVLEILDCTKFKIFESATVFNTINTWQKSSIGTPKHIGYRKTFGVSSFDELLNNPRILIKKNDLINMNQNWGLAFYLSNEVVSIINKIDSQNHHLSDYYDCSQGYIPYRLSDLILTYGKEEGTRIKNQRLWHSSIKSSDYYIQEIYGRDISKYDYFATGEYIKYGKHVACYVDPIFFTSPRLLVREITNPSIIACFISESYINDPQLLPIITKDGNRDDLYYLWGILNSKLATFFHFNHSPKATKGAFPKILVQDIKDFPLPNVTDEIKEYLIELVQQVLENHRKGEDTRKEERQIDLLVYHLYGLTYDEVLIVDPETPITREEYERSK